MSMDNLPSDIRVDIFSRLPTKALIRCTTLSSNYKSLITSPHFLLAHIARNTTNNNKPQFFLRFSHGEEKKERYIFEPPLDDQPLSGFASLSLLDDSEMIESLETVGVEAPISTYNQWFNIVGSTNGVICLCDDYMSFTNVYVLWNPSIRKWINLPRPLITFSTHGPHWAASGFGFDSLTNDFKVVRVMQLDEPGLLENPPLVEVYSLNSGCWRMAGVGPRYFIRGPDISVRTPCVVDGIIHWIGRNNLVFDDHAIVTFNVSSETFGTIDLPQCLNFEDLSARSDFVDAQYNCVRKDVVEYNGMLAVVMKEAQPRTCCIWVMKEYGVVDSWTILFHFNLSPELEMPSSHGIGISGELIMPLRWCYKDEWRGVSRVIDKLALFDTTGKIKRLVGRIGGKGYHIARYVDSMALFDVPKGDDGESSEESSD